MTHNTIIAVQFGEGLSPGNNTLYSSPPRAVSERVQGIYLEGFTATLPISHKRRRISSNAVLQVSFCKYSIFEGSRLGHPIFRTTYNIRGLHPYSELPCKHVVRDALPPLLVFQQTVTNLFDASYQKPAIVTAQFPFATLIDSVSPPPALGDHLSGNPYHQYTSQSTSEILAPPEETGCPPEPYTLGPSEVMYYCCNCGDGPLSWDRTPYCPSCHQRQCSGCRKKVIKR